MKRITKKQKEIAMAHLLAAKNGTFTHVGDFTTSEALNGVKQALMKSETLEMLHNHIEREYVSITSQLMAHPDIFGHIGNSYRKQYIAGFKTFLNRINIQ